MVKRIFVIIILMITLLCLTGCTETDINGEERYIEYGMFKLRDISGNGSSNVMYDPNTRICYLVVSTVHRYGITPYYIIGEDGKPEIAVYGVNYTVDPENN